MLLENIRNSYGLAKRVCLFCLLPILPLSCAEGEVDLLKPFGDVKRLSPNKTVDNILDCEPFGFAVRDSFVFFYSSMMGEDQLLAVKIGRAHV